MPTTTPPRPVKIAESAANRANSSATGVGLGQVRPLSEVSPTPPLTNWAVHISGVKTAGWLSSWHLQYALSPSTALAETSSAMMVNDTPTSRWLALDRKVSTLTAPSTPTTIAMVAIDPGRPNQLTGLGSWSRMAGCNATAAR